MTEIETMQDLGICPICKKRVLVSQDPIISTCADYELAAHMEHFFDEDGDPAPDYDRNLRRFGLAIAVRMHAQ